jgi:hypothetical protein
VMEKNYAWIAWGWKENILFCWNQETCRPIGPSPLKCRVITVEPLIYILLGVDKRLCKLWESVNCNKCKNHKLSTHLHAQ